MNKGLIVVALVLVALVSGAGAYMFQAAPESQAIAAEVTVYKSPTCGCCSKWEDHLRQAGFTVVSKVIENVNSVKVDKSIPADLWSCHTAVVNGYFIEGHVPAASIQKLLAQKPQNVKGLTVPGMPIGSPGMEGPNPEKYQVLSVNNEGKAEIFEEYN